MVVRPHAIRVLVVGCDGASSSHNTRMSTSRSSERRGISSHNPEGGPVDRRFLDFRAARVLKATLLQVLRRVGAPATRPELVDGCNPNAAVHA